jgi:hypothetical protein
VSPLLLGLLLGPGCTFVLLDEECDTGADTGTPVDTADTAAPGDATSSTTDWLEIAAGGLFSCGVRLQDGGSPQLSCFGAQGVEAAGSGVSLGYEHLCWLGDGGAVTCDGRDDFGQATPPALGTVTGLDAGGAHTCALDDAGAITCWGRDLEAQLTPPSSSGYTAVSAGWRHSCGVLGDGTVECWGDDSGGQLLPPAGFTASAVAAGQQHTCAVDAAARTLTCWGEAGAVLDDIPTETGFVAVEVGVDFACALDLGGSITCWGEDGVAQLDAPTGDGWSSLSVSTGGRHACALQVDDAAAGTGSVTCWGADELGQSSPP